MLNKIFVENKLQINSVPFESFITLFVLNLSIFPLFEMSTLIIKKCYRLGKVDDVT